MRLRAQILIDIEAADFEEAAGHQRRVEEILASARESYAQAQLEFRQRREQPHRKTATSRRALHYTGAMSEYDE